MNFKTTLVLLALVLVAGAIWFFFPAGTDDAAPTPAPAAAAEETKPVFETPPSEDQLARLELTQPGAPPLVFERVAGAGTPGAPEWRMTAPREAPADSGKVMTLARTITSLQSRQQLKPGAAQAPGLADMGLAPPVATVTLGTQDGKSLAVEVGGAPPMSTDTYVRVAGTDTVHVVQRDLRPQVKKTVQDFRAARLVRLLPNDAVAITVQHENQTYDLSRPPGGEWVINAPIRAQADGNKVRDKLLNPLNALNATEFVDDADSGDPARFGFAQPYLTLSVTTETRPPAPPSADTQPAEPPAAEPVRKTHALVVGGFADLKSEKRYVQVGGPGNIAILPAASLANLVPNLADLRDLKVTRLSAANITALEVSAGGATATVTKGDNGQWQGTGELEHVDADAIQDVLGALENLTATSYIDQPEAPATYGLDAPRAILKVTASGQLAPLTLLIGNETGSGRNAFIQRAGDPTVIVTTAAQADRLAVGPLGLRSREIFTFPPDQLQQVTLRRGNQEFRLARADGNWKLTQPEAPVDAAAARNIVNDLSRLRARTVVGQGNAAEYGLDQPAHTLSFEVAPPPVATQEAGGTAAPTTHTLRLNERDDVMYAQRDDDPYIFALDETVARTLTAELIDPRLFSFKPEDLNYIRIVSTGGALEFVRDGNTWKYAPEPFVELAQQKLSDFARDLAQLRAELTLEYSGADFAAAGLDDPPATLTLRLADQQEFEVRMTPERPGQLPRLAGLLPGRRTVLLRQADVEKLMRGLDEYVKSDAPAQPAEDGMVPPGAMPPGAMPPGAAAPRTVPPRTAPPPGGTPPRGRGQ